MHVCQNVHVCVHVCVCVCRLFAYLSRLQFLFCFSLLSQRIKNNVKLQQTHAPLVFSTLPPPFRISYFKRICCVSNGTHAKGYFVFSCTDLTGCQVVSPAAAVAAVSLVYLFYQQLYLDILRQVLQLQNF